MRWAALLLVGLSVALAPPRPGPSPSPTKPKPSPIPIASPSPPPPTPRPTASPSPKPSPSPTPHPSPSPSPPPPAPLVCEPASVAAVPAATPTFAGDLTVQGVAATISLTQAGPPSMLPPELGHHLLVAMLLSKPEDALSSALQDALTNGTVFPCALLGLGQTSTFSFARYAFTNVQVIGLQSALDASFKVQETFTLTYETVRWQYQLTGSSEPTEGSAHYGAGSRSVAQGAGQGGFPWAWIVTVPLVLLALAGARLRLRNRRPRRP